MITACIFCLSMACLLSRGTTHIRFWNRFYPLPSFSPVVWSPKTRVCYVSRAALPAREYHFLSLSTVNHHKIKHNSNNSNKTTTTTALLCTPTMVLSPWPSGVAPWYTVAKKRRRRIWRWFRERESQSSISSKSWTHHRFILPSTLPWSAAAAAVSSAAVAVSSAAATVAAAALSSSQHSKTSKSSYNNNSNKPIS